MTNEKKPLNLNNDADYEEHIRRLNAPQEETRPVRRVAGQFKTPVRQNPDQLDYK